MVAAATIDGWECAAGVRYRHFNEVTRPASLVYRRRKCAVLMQIDFISLSAVQERQHWIETPLCNLRERLIDDSS